MATAELLGLPGVPLIAQPRVQLPREGESKGSERSREAAFEHGSAGSDSPSHQKRRVWLGLQHEGREADPSKDFLAVGWAVVRSVWGLGIPERC